MPQQILVVGPSWVGDMVMAQSLFIVLRQRYPDAAIDVLAPPWSLPLIERMPEVRTGIALSIKHGELKFKQRYQLAKSLQQTGYDQAIILPRSLKSALIPFLANIPIRTGYKGEWRYGLINDMRQLDPVLDQTVKRFVALGVDKNTNYNNLKCPQPKLDVDRSRAQEIMRALDLDMHKLVVSIMPGAEYGPAKQWPLTHFANLIKQLSAEGKVVWIFGSHKDQLAADQIIELAGQQGVNLCGKTTLQEVVDLIASTHIAVSNDSGLMHIAAAVGKPLVAIYGSSSPAFTPPLSQHAHIMYLNIECSPCFARQCPLGHYRCLEDISSSQVAAAIADLEVSNNH